MAEVTPLDLQKPFEAKDIKQCVQQAGISKKKSITVRIQRRSEYEREP